MRQDPGCRGFEPRQPPQYPEPRARDFLSIHHFLQTGLSLDIWQVSGDKEFLTRQLLADAPQRSQTS